MAGIFEQLKDAFATFSACSALARGGALKSFKGIVLGGSATFQNCSSGREMMMADATLGDATPNPMYTIPKLPPLVCSVWFPDFLEQCLTC